MLILIKLCQDIRLSKDDVVLSPSIIIESFDLNVPDYKSKDIELIIIGNNKSNFRFKKNKLQIHWIRSLINQSYGAE